MIAVRHVLAYVTVVNCTKKKQRATKTADSLKELDFPDASFDPLLLARPLVEQCLSENEELRASTEGP